MRGKQLRDGLIAGVLLLVSFWLGTLIWGLLGKADIAMSEERNVERQYQALESRKHKLQENLDALATPQGRDAAIRTAFGVARPGEEVIVVVPPPEATTTPPTWWERFRSWF